MKPALAWLEGEYTIHRLEPDAVLADGLLAETTCWIARTPEELSIVCPAALEIDGSQRSEGWSCLKVAGPLEHGLTGILAGIAATLADAEVPIFALSTYDTDYVLVRTEQLQVAATALQGAGYPLR